MRKRLFAMLLAIMLLLSLAIPVSAAQEHDVTILFTHDLHSHLLPSAKPDGGEYGGYARLMTLIQEQKALYPDAILVDGGDFSMGSLFQTAYATSAIELRMMGAMGYDATTFGNHEYDYLPSGFASMLNVAADCGEPVPAIVEANYLPPKEGEAGYDEDSAAVWEALENYGVKEYKILERGGVYYVLFGIFGFSSHACAPNSGQILADPAQTAQRVVDAAVAECKSLYGKDPVVVCLSHSGTENGKGEDYDLAQKVTGIDVIVSGHTHTTLPEPIRVGDTYIASAGEYGKYLGVVHMDYDADGKLQLSEYKLIPVDENVTEDPAIAAKVQGFKQEVEKNYLSRYGMTFDQVLVSNPYTFDSVDDVYATAHESTLGNVFSDAYQWAAERVLGVDIDVALTASGVIRETIPVGDVTVSDIFNAASLGVGTEGELVMVYITGEDLMTALEIDATVAELMTSARLYYSGVEYSFNTNRMLLNKVDYAKFRRADGSLASIEPKKLYRVVTGMYMGQMLGSVSEMSYGIINITPRDADGNPIATEDLVNYVVRSSDGTPLKEWYAISAYLQHMDGTMDQRYAAPDGRKVIYASWNPVDLLKNANIFTFAVLAIVALLIFAVVMTIRGIRRKARKRKEKKEKN